MVEETTKTGLKDARWRRDTVLHSEQAKLLSADPVPRQPAHATIGQLELVGPLKVAGGGADAPTASEGTCTDCVGWWWWWEVGVVAPGASVSQKGLR
jgi:hypothetical protein